MLQLLAFTLALLISAYSPEPPALADPPTDELKVKITPESREAAAIAKVQTVSSEGKLRVSGTGAFIGESLFVTSLQVIDQAHSAQIVTACCGHFDVEGVVAANDEADLVFLRVKTKPGDIKWLEIAASSPAKGDQIRVAVVIVDSGVALLGSAAMGTDTWPGYGPMVRVDYPFGGLLATSPVLNDQGQLTAVAVIGGAHETTLASVIKPGMLKPLMRADTVIPLKEFAEREPSDCVKARRELFAGIAMEERGNRRGAVDAYKKSLALDPGQWRAQWLLGVSLDMQGKGEESIDVLKTAAKMCPLFSEPVYSLGLVHLKLKRDAEAIAYFDEAAKIDPGYGSIHAMRGVALHRQGKSDEAIASTQRATEVEPDNIAHFRNLTFLCNTAGKMELLAPAWRRYTNAKPDDADGWIMLSSVLDSATDLDEVVRCCRRATELQPENCRNRLQFAAALGMQEKYDEALKEIEKCLKANPKDSEAKKLKKLIEEGKSKPAAQPLEK